MSTTEPISPATSNSNAATTWLRRNLFRSWFDGVLTVVFGAIAIWLLYRTVNYVFVTGRWDIIRVNLRLLMIGRFPDTHVLRLAVLVVALSGWAGVLAGIIRARQVRSGRADPDATKFSAARVLDLVERFWLPVIVILLVLLLTSTPGPWVTAILAAVAAVVGRLVGPFIGRLRPGPLGSAVLVIAIAAVPIGLYFYVVTAVGFNDWGGLMLNIFLALCAIVLCFPLGVLLALGRRSELPLIRVVSTAYIELARGAPLFVLLLLANVALGFFLPESLTPSTSTRAIVVFPLFGLGDGLLRKFLGRQFIAPVAESALGELHNIALCWPVRPLRGSK